MTALRQYLPQIGVRKVMFISIDNHPIPSLKLQEISAYLGAPIYDSQGLVVVWNAPQRLQSNSRGVQRGAFRHTSIILLSPFYRSLRRWAALILSLDDFEASLMRWTNAVDAF